MLSGAFAVPKDPGKDRSISALCPLNSLVDPGKLWKPVFAAMPCLRAIRTNKSRRLCVFKKDARHYFHQLGIGRKWEKYLAHPPILSDHGHWLYPLHRAVPMGFTAAASWAQRCTEACTQRAQLPESSRPLARCPLTSRFGGPSLMTYGRLRRSQSGRHLWILWWDRAG